ncbi:tetratricopeptide repeat protein [Novosphingobium guangzhouense]|uniref:Uncharacterized protein n=1 Tax=Novosphingobium guangzhouense TaxID=1850347 RepID=A0A2K2G226_9SPHN|nr:tetratricopeptide repeat protein [Novosphingobium guangzhouense]PNU05087.1 hypothetical protein A8V01_04495 [Novosphingobium guangzhouense]
MRGGRLWRLARWGAAVIPPLLVLVVCFSLVLTTATPVAVGGISQVDTLIADARKAIVRGDGIDAEMKLRAALEQGAAPAEVNAYMGQALLAQNRRDRARPYLVRGEFTEASAAEGWRALGLLERLDGNLPASGRAYDKAVALTPDDAGLWVEIGRLRYAGGEHLLAIEAAEYALKLDGGNVRALEFRGQLVRDRYGLLASIPWFERAIMRDPADIAVLLEYAATLGELGHASECVTITRRVLELSPGNPRAYYLQAVLAARAGNLALARALLARTKGKLDDQPAVLILRGMTEIAARNPEAAAEALEEALRLCPDSMRARELLLRAIVMTGQYRYAILRFADDIADGNASPYMLTTVARAWEVLGDRQHAGELLDRAARPAGGELRVLGGSGRIGQLLHLGQTGAAEAAAEAMRKASPGFYDAQALAGDVQLALGHAAQAQERYVLAAQIRFPESLFQRRFAAYAMAGDLAGARAMTGAYLGQNPASRPALRAAAQLAAGAGDLDRARTILAWLRDNGGQGDVELLADLAMAQAATGDPAAAQESALAAYRLQRSSPVAAQSLGRAYAAGGNHPAQARALLDKARLLMRR